MSFLKIKLFQLFKDVINHFINGNTFQKGAALAYYAVFSIFPIIIIIISVLGLVFGKQAVSGEVFLQLKDTLGNEAANQIQTIVSQHHVNHNSIFTTIIGFATLMLTASGMFSQIHNAFNSLWNIKAKPKSSILRYFTKHLASFILLIVLFFVLIVSTSLNAFLVHHSKHLHESYRLYYLYEHLSSLIIIAFLFTLMFRFLGDATVRWKPAFIAGIFTAILFILGKIGISMYLAKSHLSTTFGTASVLALIMLWVYYTSQIIFLGASFLKIISDVFKTPILPNDNSIAIIEREIKS